MKKLYKSRNNKIVAGIIGGVGEYFNVDPTILRIVYVIVAFLMHVFPGIILYIIAYLIIPERPEENSKEKVTEAEYKEEKKEEP